MPKIPTPNQKTHPPECPPVKAYTATSSKTTPVKSHNMVTGVLNDSTNQPTKRSKQQRIPSEQQKDRPSTSKILFAHQQQTFTSANLLPMPKALTASLPVFDGKSETFELFEDLFRNNIKIHPHLTEIQTINYFHSLLRGNALQAYCNLDDTKNDNLEEVITAFKPKPDASGTRCISITPNESFTNSSIHCKKTQRRRPDPRRKNSSIKPYMPKCRITSKRSSTGHT